MAGTIERELAMGKEFASRIQKNFRKSISTKTTSQSGKAKRSTAKPFFRNKEVLERLTITTPYYIYPILDHGFEGNKKNSVNHRVKAHEFMQDALENGNLLEDLADQVGAIRAARIVNLIVFSKDEEGLADE